MTRIKNVWQGRIASIHIAPTGGAPIQSITKARAVVGKGLEGDRYYGKLGTYSNDPGSGRDVTLIESEAIESLKREYDIEIDAASARRNLVTCGVALNHLVERKFSVGAVVLRGTRLCDPCAHLEKLSRPGTQRSDTDYREDRGALLEFTNHASWKKREPERFPLETFCYCTRPANG